MMRVHHLVRSWCWVADGRFGFGFAVLQKQYITIEAYALAEETVTDPVDFTMPDVAGITCMAGDILDEFRETVCSRVRLFYWGRWAGVKPPGPLSRLVALNYITCLLPFHHSSIS
jgi:hypothetical protein